MKRLLPIAALAVLACSVARAHGTPITSNAPFAETHPVPGQTSPSLHTGPEFHPAAAVAALTLLLGGVAVLSGWRRQ